MKKTNPQRQKLLQQKRTKRNASRKGKKYNPNKYLALNAKGIMETGQRAGPITDDTRVIL